MTPVDFAARAVLCLSRRPWSDQSLLKVYFVVNPSPMTIANVFGLLETFGYRLRIVPEQEWASKLSVVLVSALVHLHRANNASICPLILCLLQDATTHSVLTNNYLGTRPRYCTRQLLRDLEGTNVNCPAGDRVLLSIYVKWAHESGFFPQP